jgi:hypothetical protein
MTKREVLKRDGGGAGLEGAQESPETDCENHRDSRHEASRLSRDSTGSDGGAGEESSGVTSRRTY